MKTTIKLFMLVAICGGLLLTNSCKKIKLNKQTTSAEDNSTAENLFDDIFKNVDETADEENMDGTNKMGKIDYTFSSTCATIVLNPPAWDTTVSPPVWNNTFPKTLTIDFGTTNCTGNDGKSRRGIITAVFTGKHRNPGTVITITTNNYYVNDYKVEGTKTVTNNGANSAGNTTYTIDVDGKITTPDAEEITRQFTRTREWIEGESTGYWTSDGSGGIMGLNGIYDDVYSITGSGSGMNKKGTSFTVNITKALRVQFCSKKREITEGLIELQPDKLKKRTIDYGDKFCDNEATVTIGKKTYTITLRK